MLLFSQLNNGHAGVATTGASFAAIGTVPTTEVDWEITVLLVTAATIFLVTDAAAAAERDLELTAHYKCKRINSCPF